MGLKDRILGEPGEAAQNGDVAVSDRGIGYFKRKLLEEVDLAELVKLGPSQRRARLESLVAELLSREGPVLSSAARSRLIRPMVDARLPSGERVNVIIPPLSLVGPVLSIRRFPRAFTFEQLVRMGSVDPDTSDLLRALVRARMSIVVSGGTSSGKTTLLNALSGFIPAEERIVTIEDSAELQLQQPHVISLEARPPNVEGKGQVTIRDLVRNSLRMRPDRIVVGE